MNIINKKSILFFSIPILMINGCVTKNQYKTKSPTRVVSSTNQLQSKSLWKPVQNNNRWKASKNLVIKKVAGTKKEDCIDCYAVPVDYSKPPSLSRSRFKNSSLAVPSTRYIRNKVTKNKHYGNYAYQETASDTAIKNVNNRKYVSAPVATNSSYGTYGTYSSDAAIQVGAFSKYEGAKRYMRKYSLLSSRYNVAIKTSKKNNKPLHRVRIEGFKNKTEAKKFMFSNRIRDAFVVIN